MIFEGRIKLIRRNKRSVEAKRVLILGGAGFIGSNLVEKFVAEEAQVTVIDGLLPNTGGRQSNLAKILDRINFISKRIEDLPELKTILASHDLIVDSMAWVAHLQGIENPDYDLALNLASHIVVLKAMASLKSPPPVIFLGSRCQYGLGKESVIVEGAPFDPLDIQGIHKSAAALYFRFYAKRYDLNVAHVIFPNCIGKNQMIHGPDIGLIGGFIRNILRDNKIESYGRERKRDLIYVTDLCKIIYRLSLIELKGFQIFHCRGTSVHIHQIAEMLVKIIGRGEVVQKDIPQEISAIETGSATLCDDKLRSMLGAIEETDLTHALTQTAEYYKSHFNGKQNENS